MQIKLQDFFTINVNTNLHHFALICDVFKQHQLSPKQQDSSPSLRKGRVATPLEMLHSAQIKHALVLTFYTSLQ